MIEMNTESLSDLLGFLMVDMGRSERPSSDFRDFIDGCQGFGIKGSNDTAKHLGIMIVE